MKSYLCKKVMSITVMTVTKEAELGRTKKIKESDFSDSFIFALQDGLEPTTP